MVKNPHVDRPSPKNRLGRLPGAKRPLWRRSVGSVERRSHCFRPPRAEGGAGSETTCEAASKHHSSWLNLQNMNKYCIHTHIYIYIYKLYA